MLAGNTRDEAKLFPTFLALSPALGGVSGRLVSDATLFNTQFSYNPDAAPTVTVEQWIPARIPARDDAGDRLQRPDRPAQPGLLHAPAATTS